MAHWVDHFRSHRVPLYRATARPQLRAEHKSRKRRRPRLGNGWDAWQKDLPSQCYKEMACLCKCQHETKIRYQDLVHWRHLYADQQPASHWSLRFEDARHWRAPLWPLGNIHPRRRHCVVGQADWCQGSGYSRNKGGTIQSRRSHLPVVWAKRTSQEWTHVATRNNCLYVSVPPPTAPLEDLLQRIMLII